MVELLVTTLFQAYAVFYLPPEGSPRPGEGALSCGMLFSTLENVTSTSPAGKQLGGAGRLPCFVFISRLFFLHSAIPEQKRLDYWEMPSFGMSNLL